MAPGYARDVDAADTRRVLLLVRRKGRAAGPRWMVVGVDVEVGLEAWG